jgi:DNA-binding CsgD family transcriptional regulator
MQLQLPFFPEKTKLINSSLGYFSKDDTVFYLHNGSPIFCHEKEDRDYYRFVLANLVINDLCTCSELAKALGINVKNVQRYVKDLREHGANHFFNREDNRGQCHKFTEETQKQAQELLDNGNSQYRVAQVLNISESAIRYHLRNGKLKKKNPLK